MWWAVREFGGGVGYSYNEAIVNMCMKFCKDELTSTETESHCMYKAGLEVKVLAASVSQVFFFLLFCLFVFVFPPECWNLRCET